MEVKYDQAYDFPIHKLLIMNGCMIFIKNINFINCFLVFEMNHSILIMN